MYFGLEGSKSRSLDQNSEISEKISAVDPVFKEEQSLEDFSDCAINAGEKPLEMTRDSEDCEEDFEDCKKSECEKEMRFENEEIEEEEDFADCALEGEQAANEIENQSREVLEARELQEIKDHISPVYENGAKIAGKVEEFRAIKEHHIIDGGHIGKVYDKSLEAADVLEASFKENSYNGLYSDRIDRKLLAVMALYHDTGMDGNVDFENFDQAKQAYMENSQNRETYIKSRLSENPDMADEETAAENKEYAYGDYLRKKHSVQSAIHVLRDREFIERHGADADKAALGCLVHSKSNLDMDNLADESQWDGAVKKLQEAVSEFNRTHSDEQIFFSDSFLKKTDGSFDEEVLAEIRSESLCLRIGDASGHDSNSRISQSGKEITFSLDDWKEVQSGLPEDLERKIRAGDCHKFKDEVQNAHVVIDGVKLDNDNDPSGFARMYNIGEGNFKRLTLAFVDGRPVQTFELENKDAYPLSTQYCILQRIKEYNTAKIEPQIEVERPIGMTDDDFKLYKEAQTDSMKKIDFVVEINLEGASELTKESYDKFADTVLGQYGINVYLHRGKSFPIKENVKGRDKGDSK